MATLSLNRRIDKDCVNVEIARLERLSASQVNGDALVDIIPTERLTGIDPFDWVQLAEVIRTCRASRSLYEAGRSLFAASRSTNDADRLRKYFARFDLAWGDLRLWAASGLSANRSFPIRSRHQLCKRNTSGSVGSFAFAHCNALAVSDR